MSDREKIEARVVELREHINSVSDALAAQEADFKAGRFGLNVYELVRAPLAAVLLREQRHLEALELTLVARTTADGQRVAELMNESDLADFEAHDLCGLVPTDGTLH